MYFEKVVENFEPKQIGQVPHSKALSPNEAVWVLTQDLRD